MVSRSGSRSEGSSGTPLSDPAATRLPSQNVCSFPPSYSSLSVSATSANDDLVSRSSLSKKRPKSKRNSKCSKKTSEKDAAKKNKSGTSTDATTSTAASPASSGANADVELMKMGRWALPLLGALADDAAALNVNLPTDMRPTTGEGAGIDDPRFDVEDFDARMRVICLRIALLESVMDMVVHTGSWAIAQDALTLIGYDGLRATDIYEKLFHDALSTLDIPSMENAEDGGGNVNCNNAYPTNNDDSCGLGSSNDGCFGSDSVDCRNNNENLSLRDTIPEDRQLVFESLASDLELGVDRFVDIQRRIKIIKQEAASSSFSASMAASSAAPASSSASPASAPMPTLNHENNNVNHEHNNVMESAATNALTYVGIDAVDRSSTEASSTDVVHPPVKLETDTRLATSAMLYSTHPARDAFSSKKRQSTRKDHVGRRQPPGDAVAAKRELVLRPRRANAGRRVYEDCVDEIDDDVDGDYAPKWASVKKQRRTAIASSDVAIRASSENDFKVDANANANAYLASYAKTEVEADVNSSLSSSCICEHCGRAFKAKLNLRIHVRNVHKRVRKFKCDQCEKDFTTRYLLQEHIKADHEGMPSHLCPVCGKGFTHLTGLKHHQLSAHEFKQERKCLSCGQDYSELCKQSGHDRGSKWNEKAFSCPSCDFRCGLKTALQKHVDTIHLKLKPFDCPQCGMSFAYKAHLQRHTEVVHEKLKKHECQECGRAFGRKHHLKYHIASVHDKRKDFVCEFCEQRFSERRRLKVHVTAAHGQATDDDDAVPSGVAGTKLKRASGVKARKSGGFGAAPSNGLLTGVNANSPIVSKAEALSQMPLQQHQHQLQQQQQLSQSNSSQLKTVPLSSLLVSGLATSCPAGASLLIATAEPQPSNLSGVVMTHSKTTPVAANVSNVDSSAVVASNFAFPLSFTAISGNQFKLSVDQQQPQQQHLQQQQQHSNVGAVIPSTNFASTDATNILLDNAI